jgi:hypothetical protein
VSRDTVVSWRTLVLFVVAPPLALLALVLFPVTLVVCWWLYSRGRLAHRREAVAREAPGSGDRPGTERD